MLRRNATLEEVKAAVASVFEPDIGFRGVTQANGGLVYVASDLRHALWLSRHGLPDRVNADELDRVLNELGTKHGLCVEIVEPDEPP
jgi:hypothetical protein